MPAVAAAATPIVFGDWRQYIVGERVGFSLERVDGDFALKEQNQVGLVGRSRLGGRAAILNAFRTQTISV